MEERDFHNKSSDVLSSLFFDLTGDASESEPGLSRRMPNNPADSLNNENKSAPNSKNRRSTRQRFFTHTQYVSLHLDECALVVRAATHLT